MPFTLTMPKLSPTMEEGIIAKWHKKEGDYVEAGDLLIEVSTDKATVEHQALDDGWLKKILAKEGSEVPVNDPIAIFTAEEKESIEGYKVVKKKEEKQVDVVEEKSDQEPAVAAAATPGQPKFTPAPPIENYNFLYTTEAEERVIASPLAKKIAKEEGLDLSSISGTGPNGRIVKRDLDYAQDRANVSFGAREIPHLAPGTYQEEAMTPARKVIGKRLQEAKTFIPHFYVRAEIDAEALFNARQQLKNGGVKVTVNDFIIRACALALREHPVINSGFDSVNQALIRFKTIDISVAVAIPDGLITPIIRHADYKNLGEISKESKALSKKARERKLEPQDYQGGSFTVSNLGMLAVSDFQAIINPPQAAILAISSIEEKPVVKEGQVKVGKIMNVTLSSDHRVIDGVAAAQFLQTLKNYLENPALLIV